MNKAKHQKKCAGKVAYPTLQAAQAAAAMMCKNKAEKGSPVVTFMRAYGCHCGKFHYGRTREIDWSQVKSWGWGIWQYRAMSTQGHTLSD